SPQHPAQPPQLTSVVHESGVVCVPGSHRFELHEPETPPQSASELQNPLMQCLPGPSPSVQLLGPVPGLPAIVPAAGRGKRSSAASGTGPGGTTVALPPPK